MTDMQITAWLGRKSKNNPNIQLVEAYLVQTLPFSAKASLFSIFVTSFPLDIFGFNSESLVNEGFELSDFRIPRAKILRNDS